MITLKFPCSREYKKIIFKKLFIKIKSIHGCFDLKFIIEACGLT